MCVDTDLEALGEQIATLASELTSGEHRLVRAIGEFDDRGGFHPQGALTCAQWLSWRIGLAPGAAREKVRVAKALRNLPLVDDAFARAVVSYSKVRALTRVATRENEADLLEIARSTTAAQLELVCRRFGVAVERDSPAEAEARRIVEARWTEGGQLRVSVQLPPDEGARLLAALDSAREASDGENSSRADGLRTLVESWFAEGARPRRGGAPHEVVLHVSAGTPAAYIENEEGPAVPIETGRRLACDASVTTLVEDEDGGPLDVGRKSRTVPASLRRALESRGRRCAFPSCTHTLFLDAHHIRHWARDGPTSLANLVLLCRRHHTYVHEHGYSLERIGTEVVFKDPAGVVVPAVPELPRLRGDAFERLALGREAEGVELADLAPRWVWEPFDLLPVVDFLCDRERTRGETSTEAA